MESDGPCSAGELEVGSAEPQQPTHVGVFQEPITPEIAKCPP